MQNFWQDSEHHVWIVREKSKKRRGKKGLIGLSEERGRTFWGRSQAWNQENSFNIPNPGGVAVLQEGRRGGGETSAWDMMRLGLREGEKKRRDELLMAQQVWPPLGNTGAWEEGRSPLRKGQREGKSVCLYLYLCVRVCVWPLPAVLPTVPPTMTVPPHRCSQCHGCQSKTTAGQWDPLLSPCEPIRSKQWQGKLCHYEMHS